jgi:large subunit ribosomal protein L9
MKLILTQEVLGLGSPGDVVEVKDGYGRNYLVPRGLAMRWTRGGERQVGDLRRAREVRDIRDLDRVSEVKGQLERLAVRLPVRAGAGGRLFGSVTVTDIVTAVRSAGGPDIDKRRIEIATPIRTLGMHEVSVRLHPEVSATVRLDVTPG